MVCPGTIKGSEKSLEFPNRALDKGTYESLTNKNYALFEAYQKLKRERHERDIADRYILVHIQHVQPVADLFRIQNTRPAGRDKGKRAEVRTCRLCVSRVYFF